MSNELLRASLQRLEDRFTKAADAGHRLQCLLKESPSLGDRNSGDPPPFAGKDAVYTAGGGYRDSGVIHDELGNPTFTNKPVYEVNGKPIANSAGEFYAFDRGAIRVVKLFGASPVAASAAWNVFAPLASDAGQLLSDLLANALPMPIPKETLAISHLERRWLYFLFDLAWARTPGSPLRVSQEKAAWSGYTIVELSEIPHLRQCNDELSKELLAKIPDPPSWYSVIDDVVAASVYAIDILLMWKPKEEAKSAASAEQSGADAAAGSARVVGATKGEIMPDAPPPCPGCGSPPAATDVDDVCPNCGAYRFRCQIIMQVPTGNFPPVKYQCGQQYWERIPPSQVKPKSGTSNTAARPRKGKKPKDWRS
jgi:hypothetical protein